MAAVARKNRAFASDRAGPGSQPPGNLEWLVSGDPASAATVCRHSAEHQPALFIATWSLSETPLAVRERIAPALAGFSHILCAYQRRFGEHDNVQYFQSLEKSLPGFAWQHAECASNRESSRTK